MTDLSRDRAEQIIERFRSGTVLVVGDLMLDRFLWGDVSRISPEAPVPVVRVRRETGSLGGAGNVAANLAALGSSVRCAGVVGEDEAGERVAAMLSELGADLGGLVRDGSRPTTVKMRIIAHSQQVVRVDHEENDLLPESLQRKLLERARESLPDVSAVVISDYDKGVVSERLLRGVLDDAEAAGLPVIIDPKLSHFPLYQPATILTPNQMEASRATAIEIRREEDVERAGRKILDMLRIRALLVTRGEHGMSLFERDGPTTTIPALAREVYDVTGAGDTVVAALTVGLAGGATLREAAALSNVAAGIVVSRLGTASVSVGELLAAVSAV